MTDLQETLEAESLRLHRAGPVLELLRGLLEVSVRDRVDHYWAHTAGGGNPVVYSRVKSSESVRRRIEERHRRLEEFPDLVGIRVVVLHSGQVDWVRTALEEFTSGRVAEVLTYRTARGRASGYGGCSFGHLPLREHVEAMPPMDRHQERFDHSAATLAGNLHWEVQIHTAMQEAWSRLAHARFYKDTEGVPIASWERLQRLAAVTDLIDEQLGLVEAGISEERDRLWKELQDPEKRARLPLDEYCLGKIQYIQTSLFAALQKVARDAGFSRSEWPELVRVGDETEICIAAFKGTGAATLGEFVNYSSACVRGSNYQLSCDRLRKVFSQVEGELPNASGRRPFDRPLLVASLLRLLDYPDEIPRSSMYIRPSLHDALRRADPSALKVDYK